MTSQKNKQYVVEVSEGEAEEIEERARVQGVTAPDFLLQCIRYACNGFMTVIDRLAETGQCGPFNKD